MRLGEFLEVAGFGDAAAVDLDVGRGPEFPHAVPAPDLHALGPGLQDGHQDDAAGAVVAVLVRQRLHRHTFAASSRMPSSGVASRPPGWAWRSSSAASTDGDGQRGDERAGGAVAFAWRGCRACPVPRTKSCRDRTAAGVRVHRRARAGVTHLADLAVGQAGDHLPGGAVDAGRAAFPGSRMWPSTMSEQPVIPVRS